MLADLTTTQATVLAAAIGAGSAIIGGLIVALFNYWSLKGQREFDTTITDKRHDHEQRLAAAARRHDDLAGVYPALMHFVITEVERMRRTLPQVDVGQSTERPPILDEAASMDLQARVYAFASEQVKQELETFLRLRTDFEGWAFYVANVETRRATGRWNADEEQVKDRSDIAQIRNEAADAMDRLRKLVRDELAS